MRNRKGWSTDLPPQEVDKVLAAAAERLHSSQTFSREQLRDTIRHVRPKLTDKQVSALEFVFFRAVAPVPTGERGRYALPLQTYHLVRHRGLRLPTGRLDLAATMQLTSILEEYSKEHVLAPKLNTLLLQGRATLKVAKIKLEGPSRV